MGLAVKSAYCHRGQGSLCGKRHGGKPHYGDDAFEAGGLSGDDSGRQVSF